MESTSKNEPEIGNKHQSPSHNMVPGDTATAPCPLHASSPRRCHHQSKASLGKVTLEK